MAKKTNSQYVCDDCGGVSIGWMGRCPECGQFGTMREWRERAGAGSAGVAAVCAEAQCLSDTRAEELPARLSTGIEEFDRVLGGGLVPGSVILVGGEPGAGKSTLLLQACDRIAASGRKVLLVSGEESADQIRLRARRLGCSAEGLFLLCENELAAVLTEAERLRPSFLVIDSIQTVSAADVDASPGGVNQVR
ncbi:MAG: ATPase domain-containing protein, partial [Candidatus Geothermincolia bacterium]